MSCNLTLHVGNNNVIELQALTNSVTGAVDTGATVTVTLQDTAGSEVTGQPWPAAMSHDTGGTYRATLDNDLAIRDGGRYVAVVNAVGSGGEVGRWNVSVTAANRTGD